MKSKLLPTTHNTTVSVPRMLLLHSIIVGRQIDVGRIIHEQAHACLQRQTSPLLFPNLITALCRKKKVPESPNDEILPGISGITKAKLPKFLGNATADPSAQPSPQQQDENAAAETTVPAASTSPKAKGLLRKIFHDLRTYFCYAKKRDAVMGAYFREMLPHVSHELPEFPTTLLDHDDNAAASPAASHPDDQEQQYSSSSVAPTLSPERHQPSRPRPRRPAEPNQPQMAQAADTAASQHAMPRQSTPSRPEDQDMPQHSTPAKSSTRRTKKTAGRVLSPTDKPHAPWLNFEPDITTSDSSKSSEPNFSPLQKRSRTGGPSTATPP